jgi:hypothetical protein
MGGYTKLLKGLLQKGPAILPSLMAVLARLDIKSAFRLLILSPEDFELFGFIFKGLYFYDKGLPMG